MSSEVCSTRCMASTVRCTTIRPIATQEGKEIKAQHQESRRVTGSEVLYRRNIPLLRASKVTS